MINHVQHHGANPANSFLNVWKTEKPQSSVLPGLSVDAEKYLVSLKEKFGNVSFIIANYDNDEEARRIFDNTAHSDGYKCLITPALLEEMASNEETAAKYEDYIGSAIGNVDNLKEEVKEKLGTEESEKLVKNYGVSINSEGEVGYYVLLKDGLPKNVYEANEGSKTVKASSIEELLEKLEKLDEERRAEAQREKRREYYRGIKDGFDDKEKIGDDAKKAVVEIDEDGNLDALV